MPKTYTKPRAEKRVPMEITVQISGHPEVPGTEMTFTENVSSRGARVLSVRHWRPNEQIVLESLPGDFRSVARVAYCQPLRGEGFAIGLEFVERSGPWVIPASSEDVAAN